MRPILIGQAPGPNTDPNLPLFPFPSTSSPGRLVEFMGVPRWVYLKLFDRTNLLHTFPGRHKRDDAFPKPLGRVAADAMRPLLHDRVVILVGRNVAEAFRVGLPFHQWDVVNESGHFRPLCFRVAVIPHPSGRNSWYRSPENKALARTFWCEFFHSLTDD